MVVARTPQKKGIKIMQKNQNKQTKQTRKVYSVNATLYAKGRCWAPDREYVGENEFTALDRQKAAEQCKKWLAEINGVELDEITGFKVNEIILLEGKKEYRGARL